MMEEEAKKQVNQVLEQVIQVLSCSYSNFSSYSVGVVLESNPGVPILINGLEQVAYSRSHFRHKKFGLLLNAIPADLSNQKGQ